MFVSSDSPQVTNIAHSAIITMSLKLVSRSPSSMSRAKMLASIPGRLRLSDSNGLPRFCAILTMTNLQNVERPPVTRRKISLDLQRQRSSKQAWLSSLIHLAFSQYSRMVMSSSREDGNEILKRHARDICASLCLSKLLLRVVEGI